jgi:hypothetical protein
MPTNIRAETKRDINNRIPTMRRVGLARVELNNQFGFIMKLLI